MLSKVQVVTSIAKKLIVLFPYSPLCRQIYQSEVFGLCCFCILTRTCWVNLPYLLDRCRQQYESQGPWSYSKNIDGSEATFLYTCFYILNMLITKCYINNYNSQIFTRSLLAAIRLRILVMYQSGAEEGSLPDRLP